MRPVRFEQVLAAREPPQHGQRRVGDEGQEHEQREPCGPDPRANAGKAEHRGKEPEADRAPVAHERPRGRQVDREKHGRGRDQREAGVGAKSGAGEGHAESAEPADRHQRREPVAAVHEVEQIGTPHDGERRAGDGEHERQRQPLGGIRAQQCPAQRPAPPARGRRDGPEGERRSSRRRPKWRSPPPTRRARPTRRAPVPGTATRPGGTPPRSRARRHGKPAGRATIGRSDDPAANGRGRAPAARAPPRTAPPPAAARTMANAARRSPAAAVDLGGPRRRTRRNGAPRPRPRAAENPRKSTPDARPGSRHRGKEGFLRPIIRLPTTFSSVLRPVGSRGARRREGPACRVLATAPPKPLPRRDFTLPRMRPVWHNDFNFSTLQRRFRWQAQAALVLPILSARGETP